MIQQDDMPFQAQIVPMTISTEKVDEALELLGLGEDSEYVTSFTYEGVDSIDAEDADTPNLVGSLTVSMYRNGIQFTATIPVVDE